MEGEQAGGRENSLRRSPLEANVIADEATILREEFDEASSPDNPSSSTGVLPTEQYHHGGEHLDALSPSPIPSDDKEHDNLYLPLHIHQPVPLFVPPDDDPGPPPPLPPDDADENWSVQISPRQRPPPAPPAPPVIVYYHPKEKEAEKSTKKRGITQQELGSFPWEKFDLKPKVVRIKDYVVIRTIGSGTYGTVKLARNEKTGQKVALKVIKKATLSQEDLQRIQRELKIITMLSHPNIIQVYDVLDTKKVTYIVMEYCGGGDLRKYVKAQPKGRLPPAQALPLFRQILCGLSYCHQHLVIHRDIKPENILLTSDLTAKIGDFGFSRTFNLRTAMQTACGSLAYAAPEVIDATIRGYIGPKSDVWSMGCVLYEILSGDLPFFEQFEWETIREIKLGRYRDTNKIHKKLLVLIERMLTPDPAKRASLREIQVHPYTWLDRPLMYALVLPFCKAILEKRGNIYSANSEDFDIDLEEDEYITKRKETQEREPKEQTREVKETEDTSSVREYSSDTSHSSEASEKEDNTTTTDQQGAPAGHRRTKSKEQKQAEPITRQLSVPKQVSEQPPTPVKDRTKPRHKVHLEPSADESPGLLKAKSAEDKPEDAIVNEERLRGGKEGEGESNTPTTRMKRSFSDPTRFQINKPGKKKNSVPEVSQVSILSPRKNSMFSWMRSGTSPGSTSEEATPFAPLSSSGNHPSASEDKVPPINLSKSPPLSPRSAKSPPDSPKKVKSPPLSPRERKNAAEQKEREKAKEKEEKKQRKEKEKEDKKKKMKEEKEGKLREKKEKEEKLREKKDLKRKMKEEEKSQRALKNSKRKETPHQHHRGVSSSSRERPEIPSPPSPPPVHRIRPSENPAPTSRDRNVSAPPLPTTTTITITTATTSTTTPQQPQTESKTTKEVKEKRYRRSVSASDLFAESPSRRLLRTNSFTSDGEEDINMRETEPERPRPGTNKPKKPIHSTLPKKLYFFKNN